MSKRFTETTKWRDKWFIGLSPMYKLAWIYICDECDHAGIIEIVEPIANIQLGGEIDWEAFFIHCGGRIKKLNDGKIWVRAFIEFQYGTLNPENRVHSSVIALLKKKGLESSLQGAKDGAKDKDKDKYKDKDKDQAWVVPKNLDCERIRKLLDEFTDMRKSTKKPIKNLANASRGLKNFESVDHLAYAIEYCIANEYQGLNPEYRPTFNNSKIDRCPTSDDLANYQPGS